MAETAPISSRRSLRPVARRCFQEVSRQKPLLNRRVAFRKKIYRPLEELQADLDRWMEEYNQESPHHGQWCDGKTPMQMFLDSVPLAKEKLLTV